jgi:hypothetical protein
MISVARPCARAAALSIATLWSLACGEPARPDGKASATSAASTRDAESPALPPESEPSLAGAPLALSACASVSTVEGAPIGVRSLDTAWVTLSLESLEQLAPRDSARVAARLARLGGSLPTDTTVADFRGLPIVVRTAWRVVPSEGDTLLAAILVRRIPIESDPMEEIFTVLTSPEARPGLRDGLRLEWMQRDVAREESVVFRDLVAVWRIPGDTVAALFAHDDERGVVGQLLVRTTRAWTSRWETVLPNCDTAVPR